MTVLKKADAIFLKFLKIMASFFFTAMVVLVVIEVLFRYFLKIPCAWSEELARLSLVWCVTLGSAVGIRLKEHPYIEMLVKKFPPKLRTFMNIVVYLVIAALGVILVIFGIKHTYATRSDFMTSLGYHKNYFYAPSFVAGFLYFVFSLIEVGDNVKQLLQKKGAGSK